MNSTRKSGNARRVGAGKLPDGRPDSSPSRDVFGQVEDTSPAPETSSAYVVVVEFARSRRAYLTLPAAEAAVARARAQGRPASLQLMRCAPVAGGSL